MKVKELIEILQEFPQDMDVVGTDAMGIEWDISVWRNSSADEGGILHSSKGETNGEWDQIVVSVG